MSEKGGQSPRSVKERKIRTPRDENPPREERFSSRVERKRTTEEVEKRSYWGKQLGNRVVPLGEEGSERR